MIQETIKCPNALMHDFKNMQYETKCNLCGMTVKEVYQDYLEVPKPKIKFDFYGKENFFNYLQNKYLKKFKKQPKEIIVKDDNIKIYSSPIFKIRKWRVKGYILYEPLRNSGNFEIVAINNFNDIFKTNFGKAYLTSDKIGSLNNKPLFIIKNHLPLSLGMKEITSTKIDSEQNSYVDGYELCYNPEVFYTAIEFISFANLSVKAKGQSNTMDWIKKHLLLIIIILIIVGFIMFTETGKQFLNKLLYEYIYKNYPSKVTGG